MDTDLPRRPHKMAAGSVRVDEMQRADDDDDEEVHVHEDDVLGEDSPEEQELDAFIEGKKRPSHLDED
jgi:hypothetical protein